MIETHKFFIHKYLLFCVPLIGHFKVCNLKDPKKPLLLDTNLLDHLESSKLPEEKSISSINQKESEISEPSEPPSKKKPSMLSRFVSQMKQKAVKVKDIFSPKKSTEKQKPTDNLALHYPENAMIDEIVIVKSQEHKEIQVISLTLLLVGKFSNEVAKIFLSIEIDSKEVTVLNSSLADFKLSNLLNDSSETTNYYFSEIGLQDNDKTDHPRIIEVLPESCSVYEIEKNLKPTLLFSNPTTATVASRLVAQIREFTLVQYSMGELKISHSSHHATATWHTLCKLNYDIALLHAGHDSIVVMSTFNELFILDLADHTAHTNQPKKGTRTEPLTVHPSVQLHNLVLKTAAL